MYAKEEVFVLAVEKVGAEKSARGKEQYYFASDLPVASFGIYEHQCKMYA